MRSPLLPRRMTRLRRKEGEASRGDPDQSCSLGWPLFTQAPLSPELQSAVGLVPLKSPRNLMAEKTGLANKEKKLTP